MTISGDANDRVEEVLRAVVECASDGRIAQEVFNEIVERFRLPARYFRAIEGALLELGIEVAEELESHRVEEGNDDDDKGWDADGFGLFLSKTRHRVLTSDEVVTLSKRVEAGQLARQALQLTDASRLTQQVKRDLEHRIADGEDARNEFARSNLRLVVNIASRYQGHGLELEDLVQEGWFGLTRAIEKFDYRKGFRFSTYATWWITQSLQRAVTNQGSAIRLPVQAADDLRRLKRFRAALRAELQRAPSVAELARAADLDERAVVHLLRYRSAPRSLDASLAVHGTSLVDVVADPSPFDPANVVEQVDEIARISRIVDGLPPLEREVLIYRFGLDPEGKAKSYEKVAALIGVGPRRVRRLEQEAISTLLKMMDAKEGH